MNLTECTFSGLGEADAVLGVPGGLAEARDLGAKLLRDDQTGRIVTCTVDAVAGGEFLQTLSEIRIRHPEITAGVKRHDIVCYSHELPLFLPRESGGRSSIR